jgi:hypothetical protein
MEIRQIGLGQWRDALPNTGVELFHVPAALGVLDDHTSATLRLYAGYKGDQVVGLCPVFLADKAVGRAVLSPPPSLGVPRLGPLVMPTSPKRRKQEAVTTEFVEALVEDLDVTAARTLFRVECPLDYPDPRPFAWSGLDVDPTFTYVIDLDSRSPDGVLADCSSSLRREIRSGADLDVEIEIEGQAAAGRIYEDVVSHFASQGESHPFSRAYFDDLLAALDEQCRIYVARTPAGEYLGGIVVLYSTDLATFWHGGVRAEYESISVNSLLHWRIIRDVLEDDALAEISGYDLFGANTRRLCRYKSKFSGDLVPYFTVESAGPEMTLAKTAYRLLP